LNFIINANIANTLRLNKNVVILDCRFQLTDPSYGYDAYLKGHIPLSRYVDLNNDLSSEIKEHGGRHPFPDLFEFGKLLGNLGIDQDTIIICYDDGFNENAARCWFLCRLVGHKFSFVLDGGYKNWLEKGFVTTDKIEERTPREFVVKPEDDMVSSMSYVKSKINHEGSTIIDSREFMRYKGDHEPIDRIAGHIPGAKHSFWKDALKTTGEFKSKEDLKDLYSNINKDNETIVYCGSGVTGCVNYLGLIEAGFSNVKLYAGSFSDWISYQENVVNKIK
jgi:thiosulfate/3-mercaptopyruvate sulfurtransferase